METLDGIVDLRIDSDVRVLILPRVMVDRLDAFELLTRSNNFERRTPDGRNIIFVRSNLLLSQRGPVSKDE